jgi:hypothetical protein
MSRRIPPVRTWRLKCYREGSRKPALILDVLAPTKHLACLAVNHRPDYCTRIAFKGWTRVTLGIVRKKESIA